MSSVKKFFQSSQRNRKSLECWAFWQAILQREGLHLNSRAADRSGQKDTNKYVLGQKLSQSPKKRWTTTQQEYLSSIIWKNLRIFNIRINISHPVAMKLLGLNRKHWQCVPMGKLQSLKPQARNSQQAQILGQSFLNAGTTFSEFTPPTHGVMHIFFPMNGKA